MKSPYTPEEIAARDREAFRAHDLLQSGYVPKSSDLDGAPILENWIPVNVPGGVVLQGVCVNHPRLRPGEMQTSTILAIDEKAGWARSYGRWFRLGKRYVSDVVVETGLAEDFPDEVVQGRKL